MSLLSKREVRVFFGKHVLSLGILFAVLLPAADAFAQFGGRGFGAPSYGESVFTRLLAIFLGALVGYAIGAFFSPKLKPLRRILWLVVAVLVAAFAIFGPYPIADFLSYFAAAIVFFIALAIGKRLGAKFVKKKKEEKERPTSYGSAKWADFPYLQEHGVIGSDGFSLGRFHAYGEKHPLTYRGARHLLTVAPTRSGKGVSAIIPNLLAHSGSALIVDPKGENALITAHRRGKGSSTPKIQGMGQDIVLLDPWDVAASKLGMKPSRFNPLDWIKADDADAVENSFLLADALVISEVQGEARFWDEEAKSLLTGLILYVATAPEEAENRTLGRVRDILTADEEALKKTLMTMFKHPNAVVSSTAARTADKDPKLRSSVFASAQSHTNFLDSPRIRESISKSDFSFADLKSKKSSIYLILPADRLKTFDRWLRMLIQQAITVNARNIADKPDKPILFMLDEMATLGRLPMLEQAFGLMAGFGMQLWGIVQDLSQLANIYGQNGWQTFISNSGVIQYFGSRDKMTAEYFSSLCGVTTIEVHNISWAIGKAFSFASSSSTSYGGGSSSGSSSTSYTSSDNWGRTNGVSEAQRQLAYPDELMVLRGNEQIIFIENLDPVAAEKVPWFEDENLNQLGVNLMPEAAKAALAAKKPQPAPVVAAPEPAPVVAAVEVPKPVVAPVIETPKLAVVAETPKPTPEPPKRGAKSIF